MPSYLDFDSTKRFRDYILGKTLNQPNGPQTFSKDTYTVQTLSEMSNTDLPAVDFNRGSDLLQPQNSNTFKPFEYFVTENINTLPRRANLQLYPYFVSGNHNLISIIANSNYDTESELFKFAAFNIKNNPNGPVFSRIQRNLEASTNGRLRILDALNGSTATASNIITGREPLIEPNNRITVARTLPGKAIDFIQTVAGVEFPWSEIPGDYLSDPRNPINYRPEASTQVGKIFQDVTGALGSLIGIQRRPKLSRKPSDLMIEYLGEGQKYRLFDALSYSKYAPNYTTTARSQNTSKLFNFIDRAAQGVKNILGAEAPSGIAYIGDDRGNDVKYAMGDFNDRQVRSSYYLGLMFDPVQAELFQRTKNISQGGSIGGNLTWISKNSRNKLGEHNKEWDSEQSIFSDVKSTNHTFREDSILGYTQEILDSLPMDGAASRSHVANVIDQTSRFFRDGDVMISRGSAVKYVKNSTGEDSGVEYCRVWTKDRSYMNYSDTMKRTGGVRKYDKDSVLTSPWNLNIGPMSNGKKDFSQSTNIFPIKENQNVYGEGQGFYAKKYMFSIENLAWKTSNLPGFTVQDLPYCERGSNGGRVMWFPPYDLKVSEQNSAKWEENSFLGRPEPIYTYQNTTRSGQISFKVVVDHPSILNLLVREHFEGMSDEESENYINAFFSGCEDIDFYDLIRRYEKIDSKDAQLIDDYFKRNTDPEKIKKFRTETEQIPLETPKTEPVKNEGIKLNASLLFANDRPSGAGDYKSASSYSVLYNQSIGQSGGAYTTKSLADLEESLTELLPMAYSGTTAKAIDARNDIKILFGTPDGKIAPDLFFGYTDKIQQQKDNLQKTIDKGISDYTEYTSKLTTLKEDISKGDVQEITITVDSSCSAVADNVYNFKLSVRRSHSILTDILDKLKIGPVNDVWKVNPNTAPTGVTRVTREISFKDLGYTDKEGKLIFISTNNGELAQRENKDCSSSEFKNKPLKINSAIAFGCRQSKIQFEYTKAVKKQESQEPKDDLTLPRTRLVEDGFEDSPNRSQKPLINPMKRVIMKALSECHYFKTLEEKDPVVFGSLKEKLKYFHPAFHSTTPEGLNSRLTFIQQCIRPGDTIPIKGISDALDIDARNTTFGPPPICVLRIGDFYHSKIIIRDVNITFDDTTWDMNPEGIGMQPMIANVSLQVNFIGGQGLSKPVERLQNALSSNFYANTEMYDERSESTVDSIGGKNVEEFTKEFLDSLQREKPTTADSNLNSDGKKLKQGIFIGSGTSPLNYSGVINDVFSGTTEYFNTYKTTYEGLNKEYGPLMMKMIFSPDYRQIKTYDVYTSTSTTPGTTIDLVGLYKYGNPFSRFVGRFRIRMIEALKNENLVNLFGFDKDLTTPKIIRANELLRPYIIPFVENKINALTENKSIKDFEIKRDSLITKLDKVNYLVKYGHDMVVRDDKAKKVTLSGYTYNLIYDEYESCIDDIKDNTGKMYSEIDNTINFDDPTFNTNLLSTLLSNFLSFNKTDRTKLIEVFNADNTIFDEDTKGKLTKRLDKFIKEPPIPKLKFKKIKERKNDKDITFAVVSEEDATSFEMSQDSKNMFATKELARNNKLNFYRNE